MNDHLTLALRRKLDDLASYGSVDVDRQRNFLKEELHYHVLNFIYHHPKYSGWIMYGGSALRICHELNRMSVDLDFEIIDDCTTEFLGKLKTEIAKHFTKMYGFPDEALKINITHGRGLLLRFVIGDALAIGHPSKQVHVKIDLEHFVAKNTVTERIPVNHDQVSFVITTYNRSALMASKIAAIFLRGKRGIGKSIYEEKGRDIYDLLWYMNEHIRPDLNYLAAKGVDIPDLRKLFDKLTLQMNKVNDANLRQDLLPLFLDQTLIQNWLSQWRESYFRLVDAYKIRTVTKLREVRVHQDFDTDNFSFVYVYDTEEQATVRVRYAISDDWMENREREIPTQINNTLVRLIRTETGKGVSDKLKQFATLFYQKTEGYLIKTNRVVMGNSIATKTIRMTADKLNQKEQIVLDRLDLLSCELEKLLQ